MSENPIPSGMDNNPVLPEADAEKKSDMENTPSLPEQEAEKKKRRRDFWLGMIGSIVGNLVLIGLVVLVAILGSTAMSGADENAIVNIIISAIIWALNILPWALNIIVIILALVKHRPGIVLGILASYAIAFVLVLIAGVILTIYCFGQTNQL